MCSPASWRKSCPSRWVCSSTSRTSPVRAAISERAARRSRPPTATLSSSTAPTTSSIPRSTVPYDPTKDFDPVTLAVTAPAVLTVNPTLPVDTVRDLVALIKAHPGKYSYASPGVGTPPHLVGELFRLSLGLDLVHVPFNGGGRGPHADFVRIDGAGRAADQRREAAGAGGLDQDALAGAA